MKKYVLLFFTFHFSLFILKAQGTWTPRSPLPAPDSAMFQGIPGFSIGNYGYAGLGNYSHESYNFSELWQFNPAINSWVRKADFPGKARIAPACFVIGNYAYLVCGSVRNGGTCVNECWQYDATTDTWTQKANFPGGARTYAVGFAIDSLGYVGTGANELTDFYKDFYAYHPSTNTWTRIANFGGIARSCASGFAVNGKGYVCFGQDSLFSGDWMNNDMWAYDPSKDTWTQKSDCPCLPLYTASGFAICSNLYVGDGFDSIAGWDNQTFWKYNTTLDSWTQEPKIPGVVKLEGAAFAIGDTGYYGFGCDSNAVVQNDFYKFYAGDSCNSDAGVNTIASIAEINIYPNPTEQYINLNFSGQVRGLVTLSVMDITGRIVVSEQLTVVYDQITVDVSNLSSGMYFINLKTKDLYVTQKFIKQ